MPCRPRVLFRSELAGFHTLVVDSMHFSAKENVYLKLLQLVAWQCSCRGGGGRGGLSLQSNVTVSSAILGQSPLWSSSGLKIIYHSQSISKERKATLRNALRTEETSLT